MLSDLISKVTTNQYLVALIYLVIWFIVIKLGVFVIEKIILKLTVKTKTDLDDIIIKKSSKPITFIALIVGINIAVNKLVLSEIFSSTLEKVFFSLIFITSAYLVYVIFNLSFERVWKRAARKANVKPNEALIQLTRITLKVILIILAVIYILSYWGVEIAPLLAGVGIGGIAIAFAMQSALSNIFGGVSIILDKTIRVGDWIKLEDGTVGIILKIGLRSTKLKTFDNEILFVPNSTLSNTKVQNIALPEPKARVVIPFGVAYGSSIEKVKRVVLREIKKVSHFIKEPEPTIKFLEMGDSSLNFKAYFYVDSFENRFSAIDEANTKIYNALNKAKIEIPFPQMDVHMKKK